MYLINFPNKLKRLRLANNLTQQELANILETTKQAVSSYESGKSTPSLNSLIKLSEHFNISLDSLVFDNKNKSIDFTSNLSSIDDLRLEIKILQTLQKKINSTFSDLLKENNVINSNLIDISGKLDSIDSKVLNYISTSDCYSNEYTPFQNQENNEHLSTLEKDNIAPEDSSDNYFDYDNYLSYNFNDSDEYTKLPLLGEVAAGNPREAIEIVDDYYSIPSDRLSPNCEYFLLRVKGDSMNKLYDNGDILLVQRKGFFDNGTLVIALIDTDDPIDRYNATFKRYYKYDDIIELHPESTNPIHKVQKYSAKDTIILGTVLGSLREYVE